MKTRTLLASTVLACAALLAFALAEVVPPNVSASVPAGGRIRFRITAVEESAAGRKVVFDAAVEGPPGTDFNVNLQDGRFEMRARFLSDLADGGGLTLRARLDTRRLYGYSEAGLPLYEEDAQRHTLGLNFDEAVVLLPFGGGGDAGRLSVEIRPERLGRPGRVPSGDANTPAIPCRSYSTCRSNASSPARAVAAPPCASTSSRAAPDTRRSRGTGPGWRTWVPR